MTSYSFSERLQPSLLDRLRDDEPNRTTESIEQQVLNVQELRELITRDLAWLLNCDNLECAEDLSAYPDAKRSVLNYGINSFSGKTLSNVDAVRLEQDVRSAILTFEPRIIPQSLEIRAVLGASISQGRKTVSLEIAGKIWAKPFSLDFLLRSEMDLDTGDVVIKQVRKPN